MLEPGTYRLYSIFHTMGKPEERLVGRFWINGGELHILEDHNNLLSDSLLNGKIDQKHEKVLWNLIHSGYYKVIPESGVNEGHYDDMAQDLDIGEISPDQEYIVSGATLDSPMRLEMHGENLILDGKRLSEEEVKSFMSKVHSQEYTLVPI